jgi:ornithine lipid hydroxylase
MRTLIARHLLWLSVGTSLVAFLITRAQGGPLEAVVTLCSLVVLMLAAGLERWMPHRPDWNRASGYALTDVTSAAVLLGGVDPLLKAALPVALVALWPAAAQVDATARWANGLPFALQVVAALLWIELAKYGAHRWHHTNRGLWWLHALHHSSRRLYTLNNFRFHPLNHAINQLFAIGPLLLLGVPAEVLLACLAITQPVLMLQHANIELRSGWLNRVFSSNEAHRWHHSASVAEANCNFGSALLLWDHVFGTWRAPDTGRGPAAIGLFGDGAHYPATRSYLAQLGSMFGPVCCRR